MIFGQLAQKITLKLLAPLIISALVIAPSYGEGQSNQHSFEVSRFYSFSFEQHARDYSNATWTPDSEVSISASQLQKWLKQTDAKKRSFNTSEEQPKLNYKALVSTKSFGIEAKFMF